MEPLEAESVKYLDPALAEDQKFLQELSALKTFVNEVSLFFLFLASPKGTMMPCVYYSCISTVNLMLIFFLSLLPD